MRQRNRLSTATIARVELRISRYLINSKALYFYGANKGFQNEKINYFIYPCGVHFILSDWLRDTRKCRQQQTR